MRSRSEIIAGIKSNTFDLCVIGGGATGAGCALDAQLRGLRTLLLDAGDFAAATSSASTKLVHGGVRYLQQAVTDCDIAQYRVVKRALHERKLMLDNAPYLAQPLELLVPCFSRRDVYYFRAGMKLYDWLSGKSLLSPSRCLSVEESLKRLPRLNPSGLVGTVSFADGQFDDARYGIALINTFSESGGAALNYARVVGFERGTNGKLAAVQVQDQLSQECFTVPALAFLNATGPFSDQVRELASPGVPKRLRLSKGIHILLPLDDGFTTDALLIPKTADGRVIFAIPWLGRLLVGTTEDEATLDEELIVKQEEIDYLLRHLNPYLARPFKADQVVSAMAGLRPLVSSGDTRNTQSLIRDSEVEINRDSGLISILGGKWTTYRAMAEDGVNAVQRYLGLPVLRCITQHYRLTGALGYTPPLWQTLVSRFASSPETAQHLTKKFGADASRVLELTQKNRSLAAPIVEGYPGIQAEVVYAIRYEMAVSIEDVLARRIGLQWFSWESAIAAAPVVGAYFAREYGWTPAQTQQAVREYTGKLKRITGNSLKPEQSLAG
jgi:glycerol-3-phosphate dehydrogenase